MARYENQTFGVYCPLYAYSFVGWTKDTGQLIPELTSFEERLKLRCFDATVTSTAK
jgi:hypothetical protein